MLPPLLSSTNGLLPYGAPSVRLSQKPRRAAASTDRAESLARLERTRQAHALRAQALHACYGVSVRRTGHGILSRRSRVGQDGTGAGDAIAKLGPLLGEGATARVYLSKFGASGSEVAAKVVPKGRISAQELQWVREEARLLGMLHHAHICRLHGLLETPERCASTHHRVGTASHR